MHVVGVIRWNRWPPTAVIAVICLCIGLALSHVETNDVTGRSGRHATAAAAEFTTYDVTEIHIYSSDGQRLDTTELMVGHRRYFVAHVNAFNRTFVLDLYLNRYMFGESYIEKSVTDFGERRHRVNHTQHHCYYTGSVRGPTYSTAAFSTCHGIVGYYMVDGEVYHIEPQGALVTSRHLIYRESDSLLPAGKCGTENVPKSLSPRSSALHLSRKMRSVRWPQDLDKKMKVVELYVVNDYSQYLFHGADEAKVTSRTKDIVNVLSSLYQPLNIYVVLVGVEVWTDRDLISVVSTDTTETLNNFLAYRRSSINPQHYNDNAQLVTNVQFDGNTVGKATIGTMCTYRSSGGINSDSSTQPARVGTTMAHEMGHNFGFVHDTDQQVLPCPCDDPSGNCIMHPADRGLQLSKQWSQCSKTQLKESLARGIGICLNNVPDTYISGQCGNGIVDDGEQCDCGLSPNAEDCNAGCCNSTTCQLIGAATCAAGRCCHVAQCQLKSQATMCRDVAGDCDVPEYCNGDDSFCPTDVYKRDGTNCTVDGVSAFCYEGQCRSLESQCQLLWGRTSQVSNSRCFDNFNVAGKSSGHCGIDWAKMTYMPCAPSDVMCGQLHCTEAGQLSSFLSSMMYLTIDSYITVGRTKHDCDSAIIDVGAQNTDPALAPNGAKCGDGKMCLSQQCVDVASLPSCSDDCGTNGVCNSVGECHCKTGYAPPDCSGKGCGGSYHGGSPTPGCINTRPSGTDVGLIVGLCIFFLVILPLLVLGIICGYRRRDTLLAYWRSTVSQIQDASKRRTADNVEASRHSTKTSAPSRPRPPLVHLARNSNNNSGGTGKVAEPTRAAPVPPQRPTQPAAYSVSTGVSIIPVRAAPTPPAKPPHTAQPPAKPPKPGASEPPIEPLDPRRLRPAAGARPDDNRPPLPQKPTVT